MVRRRGFGTVNIDPRSRDSPENQGLRESLFINDGSARSVYQQRRSLHETQFTRTNQSPCVFCQGDVETNDIAFPQKIVKRHEGGAKGPLLVRRSAPRVVVEDPRVKPGQDPGHLATDGAKPYQADRLANQYERSLVHHRVRFSLITTRVSSGLSL